MKVNTTLSPLLPASDTLSNPEGNTSHVDPARRKPYAPQSLKNRGLRLLGLESPSHRTHLVKTAKTLVSVPPLTDKNLTEAEKLLKKLSVDSSLFDECALWLAICKRLRGHPTVEFFSHYLEINPTNRLAQVNLVASYIDYTGDFRPAREPHELITMMQQLHEKNPGDLFAKLLEGLCYAKLIFDSSRAIQTFEEIYLADKTYTPAISALALLLWNSGRYQSALDYGTEASLTEPLNFQSYFCSEINPDRVGPNFVQHSLDHMEHPTLLSCAESLLFGAYNLQDPLFARNDSD